MYMVLQVACLEIGDIGVVTGNGTFILQFDVCGVDLNMVH